MSLSDRAQRGRSVYAASSHSQSVLTERHLGEGLGVFQHRAERVGRRVAIASQHAAINQHGPSAATVHDGTGPKPPAPDSRSPSCSDGFQTTPLPRRGLSRAGGPTASPAITGGSINVATGGKHKTMPYRCRDCRKWFSVRTGTVLQSSKLGLQVWAIAIYLMSTNLKGVSSMKLHRDLT